MMLTAVLAVVKVFVAVALPTQLAVSAPGAYGTVNVAMYSVA